MEHSWRFGLTRRIPVALRRAKQGDRDREHASRTTEVAQFGNKVPVGGEGRHS